MTGPTAPSRYAFEHPDDAGCPDRKGTLSQGQTVLIDVLLDDPHAAASDFEVVNDEKTRRVLERQRSRPPGSRMRVHRKALPLQGSSSV